MARSNADAATRTARGQAVDAIAADLRTYTAEAEAERAKVLAEGERTTAERIMDTERDLLQNSHDETMDLLEHVHQSERDGVEDEQWTSEQALKQQEATTTLGHTGEGGSGSPGPGDTDWKRGHPRGALGEKAQPFRDGQMGRNCC